MVEKKANFDYVWCFWYTLRHACIAQRISVSIKRTDKSNDFMCALVEQKALFLCLSLSLELTPSGWYFVDCGPCRNSRCPPVSFRSCWIYGSPAICRWNRLPDHFYTPRNSTQSRRSDIALARVSGSPSPYHLGSCTRQCARATNGKCVGGDEIRKTFKLFIEQAKLQLAAFTKPPLFFKSYRRGRGVTR